MPVLIATESDVFAVDTAAGTSTPARGLTDRPTCLAADPRTPGRAYCGTRRSGVFRSDDAGASWRPLGLDGRLIMSVAGSPAEPDVVWAGTEPSAIWRSADGGGSWEATRDLEELPSSSEWSFPPKPETHHVRWLACHPREPGRLWAAIEAGALISTTDGGRSWRDRVAGGPWDTHELAIHPERPDTLRVSAGDGYFESHDAGQTWASPDGGLDVGYLRSVAIHPERPDTLRVSAGDGPYTAYVAGRADGRLYRREGHAEWQRVREGWPERPSTIAPLLMAGGTSGELWAADERGLHHSGDGGSSWIRVAEHATSPDHLRGLALTG